MSASDHPLAPSLGGRSLGSASGIVIAPLRRRRSLRMHGHANARALPDRLQDRQEILRAWVAVGAQHPHQTGLPYARPSGERIEPDGRVDHIAHLARKAGSSFTCRTTVSRKLRVNAITIFWFGVWAAAAATGRSVAIWGNVSQLTDRAIDPGSGGRGQALCDAPRSPGWPAAAGCGLLRSRPNRRRKRWQAI